MRNVACMAVSETRRRSDAAVVTLPGGWTMFEAPGTTLGQYGVALLISPSLMVEYVRHEIWEEHRILAAHFTDRVVVSVYLPTFKDSEARDRLFALLLAKRREIGRTPLILAGDFNARPPGTVARGPLTRACRQLEAFLAQAQLRAVNVNFPGQGTPLTHTFGTLDYIIINPESGLTAQNLRVTPAPFRSDHKVVLALLRPRPPPRPRQRGRGARKPDLKLLQSAAWQEKFSANVLAALPHPAAVSYGELCEAIHSGLAALPKAPQRPKLTLPWNSALVKALFALQDRTNAVPEEILLSAMESNHIGDVERLLVGYGDHLRRHPKRAWDFIRAITPNATWKMPAASARERLAKFHRHFSSLFRAPAREAPPPLEVELCPFQPRWNASPEFSIQEIVVVQGELNRWKSVGLDEIPNESLKCPQLAGVLLTLMNRMLRGEVMDEQKVSVIVPLPKKGDLSQPGNWRGISLMSHITKMFDKLLHHRVRDALDQHLNVLVVCIVTRYLHNTSTQESIGYCCKTVCVCGRCSVSTTGQCCLLLAILFVVSRN
jgi:endonuclease/exonuclease/phosphatase family metal-dependent hydrolase